MVTNFKYRPTIEGGDFGRAMSQLFLSILDPQRQALLPKFERLKDRFYLAGGTALALQLGRGVVGCPNFIRNRP